ncbi:hypothetical protein LINGRAPRIM_LOCUS174 [Linum grandiflorum]
MRNRTFLLSAAYGTKAPASIQGKEVEIGVAEVNCRKRKRQENYNDDCSKKTMDRMA